MSHLLFKLFQHPIAERVSGIALKICQSTVEFFKGVPQLNLAETESNEFEKWLSQYIHDINGHSGVATPLHAACRFQLQVIPLLLGAGADPSAVDENGWAPLHFLFMSFPSGQLYNDEEISTSIELLLDAGAHMDQLNSDGQRPLDFCKSLQLRGPYPHLDAIVKNILPFNLSCFSAQVIV